MNEEKIPEVQQIMKDREVSIEKAADTINWMTEELKYKEDQLDNEIIEENVSQLYNLISFPKDRKKPRHVIKIEVGMIKRVIKAKKKTIKIMEELQRIDQAKEEKNASKSG